MLDIIYSLFNTVIHGVTTLLNMIAQIPAFVSSLLSFVYYLPTPFSVALSIAVCASVIIAIKRLVL